MRSRPGDSGPEYITGNARVKAENRFEASLDGVPAEPPGSASSSEAFCRACRPAPGRAISKEKVDRQRLPCVHLILSGDVYTQAMAALTDPMTAGPEIVDLRSLTGRELDPLLLEETVEWRRELDWDFGRSADL